MNAERLLEVYEQISEAPDAIARLRRFVLDLAVRGKLVEQDAGDEPVSQLYTQIQKDKTEILKSDGFKKHEGDLERDQSAFPFRLPVNWSWMYLDDIAAIARGGSPRPIKSFLTDDPEGIPWIKIGDSTRGSIYIEQTEQRIVAEGVARSRMVAVGDLLLSNSMSFGFPYITKVSGCIHDGWLVIRPVKSIEKLYLHLVFMSDYAKTAFTAAAAGAVVQNLNAEKVRLLAVPLPPLAEQHRIVAKVDELMALCDRLEEARKTREETRDKLTAASLARLTAPDTTPEDFPAHASFALETLPSLTTRPDQIKTLRQTILNLAVRGKLVDQDPVDDPASELLAKITADKKNRAISAKDKKAGAISPMADSQGLFNLPPSWLWVRFGDVTISRDGERKPVSKAEREGRAKTYDYYGASGVIDKIDGYLFDKPLLLIGEDGANLINRSTPIAFIARGQYWVNNHAHVLDGLNEKFLRFLELFINATDLTPFVTGTAQPKMNQAKMNSIPVAIPPLAEQHRIVTKVDALMALCDQLEAALTTTDTTRTRLLEALLHEALEPATNTLEAAE